jgi:hypothetical protein
MNTRRLLDSSCVFVTLQLRSVFSRVEFSVLHQFLVTPISPAEQFGSRPSVHSVRNENNKDEESGQARCVQLEIEIGNFTLAVPFLNKLVLLDGHAGGKGSRHAALCRSRHRRTTRACERRRYPHI